MNSGKHWLAVTVTAALPFAVAAQSGTGPSTATGTQGLGSTEASRYSLIPSTTRGYIGANLGVPSYDLPCVGSFACEDPDVGGKIYTGGSWNEMFGVELGYINFGEFNRAGGDTMAQGVNLSLVGNLPLTQVLNVFAKVGTTYGWSETTAGLGSGVRTGDDDGFGLSYGAGVGFDLTRNFTVVAEWERHSIKVTGDNVDTDLASLGVKYRF